jgi:hypothetical protein
VFVQKRVDAAIFLRGRDDGSVRGVDVLWDTLFLDCRVEQCDEGKRASFASFSLMVDNSTEMVTQLPFLVIFKT